MSLLKKNIAANFAGGIWQLLMSVAFVPLYLKFIGIESYGIIGIFITLQAVLVILDMGISSTLNREMARLSVLPDSAHEMRNLVRSLEFIYWVIAILIGVIIIGISPLIVHYWIKAEQLSSQAIQQAFIIMGIAMALQWPSSLYSGALMGLQKQVLLNVINISAVTMSSVGAILLLWLVSPTVQVFFMWQAIIYGIKTFLLAMLLWNKLPQSDKKAVFQKQLLAGIWKFAAGMGMIGILSTILTQMDKILLSNMLTLEMFGYYALAGTVASALYCLIGPIFYALYPRFTQLVSLGNMDSLKLLYHQGCQLMSVLILPVAVVIALFSNEILLIWTQNPVTAEATHLLVSMLICGTALHGLMYLPYAMQLANGWTKLSLYTNLVAVIIQAPLIIYLTSQYGAVGGASAWLILTIGYTLIVIQFMHQRLLTAEKWHWYTIDVGMPLLASLITAGTGRLIIGGQMSQIMTAFGIMVVSISTLAVTALITPTTRSWLMNEVLKIKLS